jgi:MFS family permease
VLRGLWAGVRHLRAHEGAQNALLAIAAVRMAIGLLMIATLVLARNQLSDSPEQGLALLATTATAAGVGALLGAIVTPAATRRLGRAPWSVACLLGAAGSTLGLVTGVGPYRVIVVSAVTAAAAMSVKIGVDSLLHATVADEYRGRVFSVYDAIFNAALILAAVVGAAVVPQHGHNMRLFVAITILLLLGAMAARGMTDGRALHAPNRAPSGTPRRG